MTCLNIYCFPIIYSPPGNNFLARLSLPVAGGLRPNPAEVSRRLPNSSALGGHGYNKIK